MRRTAALLFLLSLLVADRAWGAGGGGTSGFGGGGGGGGGFSGGGGSGSGGGGTLPLPVFLLLIGGALLFVVFGIAKAARMRAKRQARHDSVVTASAVAADEDEAFDSATVLARADELFRAVQKAWDERDREALAALAGPSLMDEWRLRLDDFDKKGWHNRVALKAAPAIQYVGLVNKADDADDRVVVYVSCRAEDYVQTEDGRTVNKSDSSSKLTVISEFWTLAKHEGHWRVESIESFQEGQHHLDGKVVTTPWDDDQQLTDEAVAERSAAEALPAGMSPAEVADLDFDGPARTAAQDLALADGRFDPALIEASVRRVVGAWVTAVDGADDALEATATPEAVEALLYPGDASRGTRLVVRGPQVEAIRITALDAGAEPPELSVEIAARGRRYVEDRDSAAVLSGSRERETGFTEHWTLVLDGTGEWPWRIAQVGTPAGA